MCTQVCMRNWAKWHQVVENIRVNTAMAIVAMAKDYTSCVGICEHLWRRKAVLQRVWLNPAHKQPRGMRKLAYIVLDTQMTIAWKEAGQFQDCKDCKRRWCYARQTKQQESIVYDFDKCLCTNPLSCPKEDGVVFCSSPGNQWRGVCTWCIVAGWRLQYQSRKQWEKRCFKVGRSERISWGREDEWEWGSKCLDYWVNSSGTVGTGQPVNAFGIKQSFHNIIDGHFSGVSVRWGGVPSVSHCLSPIMWKHIVKWRGLGSSYQCWSL